MSYELLDEDDRMYRLKHPDGKEISIAKQAVSDAVHTKIRGMAKGGRVENPFEGLSASADLPFTENPDLMQSEEMIPNSSVANQRMDALQQLVPQIPTPYITDQPYNPAAAAGQMSGMGQPQAPQPQQIPSNMVASNGYIPRDAMPVMDNIQHGPAVGGEATPVAPDGQGLPSPVQIPGLPGQAQAPSKALGQMQQAANIKGKAESAYYQSAQKLQEQEAINQMEYQNKWAENRARIDRKLEPLMQSIATHKIDPNRLWGESSTGGKVSAAIGMILGGLGAGLTGGPNQALQMIEKMVDRDIDAQKSELGKKQTIYSMYLNEYKDADMAYSATKVASAAIVNAKLQAAAAGMGSQTSKAAAMSTGAQIQMYKDQLSQQLAQQQTIRQIMQHSEQTGDTRFAQYLPEKQREEVLSRAVPGYGMALTKEGATKANEKIATINDAMSGLKQLRSFADKPLSSLTPTDRAAAETLAATLKGKLRTEIVGPGAVSESEWALLNSIVADPTKVFKLDSSSKKSLDTLMGRLDNGLRTSLVQFGLRPKAKLDLKPVK